MPLKAIYERSPLTTLLTARLRAGCVRTADDHVRQVYQLLRSRTEPLFLNAAFLLGCACEEKPAESPAAAAIRGLMGTQDEKGALSGDPAEEIAQAQAILSYYELTAERPCLEALLKWAVHVKNEARRFLDAPVIHWNPADLIALITELYRISGKGWVFALLKQISDESADWSGLLSRYNYRKVPEVSEDSPEDYRETVSHCCDPECLCDAVRSAFLSARITAGGRTTEAARTGWERVMKYHGSVIGTVSGMDTVSGTSPVSGVRTAAVCAMTEALCEGIADARTTWCCDALDILRNNALPAVIAPEGILASQRVNTLGQDENAGDAEKDTALLRAGRAWAALIYSAVSTVPGGFCVNMPMDGTYYVTVNNQPVVLKVSGNELTVRVKEKLKAGMMFRIPSWCEDARLELPAGESAEGKPGSRLPVVREWRDGEKVRFSKTDLLRVREGHHQGVSVLEGSVLMRVPCEELPDWNVAVAGKIRKTESGIVCPVRKTALWSLQRREPGEIPVLPETEGEVTEIVMKPYAGVKAGLALLPKGKDL